MAQAQLGQIALEAREGDITELACDAIVNAANNHLWMGAGVAGAIKRKGREEIEREAVKLGPIGVGEAVGTTAGKLAARYVIHGAVMGQDLQTDADTIARTTLSCLKLADNLKLQSIALPALGTGVGGFPLEEAARIMVAQAAAFAQRAQSVRHILFILFGQLAYEAFAAEVERLIQK